MMKAKATPERRLEEDRNLASVIPIVERLREVVEIENRQLAERRTADYLSHTHRKNQGLLELTRMKATLEALREHPAARAAFADLAAKLELNHRLLGAQLRAARTISSLVAHAIREGQSDGTYSAYPWRD